MFKKYMEYIGIGIAVIIAAGITEDLHKDRKVDFIMANPPFYLKGWRKEDELTDDYRWRGYSVPRESNANYAWILHMISKLDVSHGIASFLLANGALNDPDEFEIRKQLLKNDKVEAIIVLPTDMFYTRKHSSEKYHGG